MHNEIYIANIQTLFINLLDFTVTKNDAVNSPEKIDVIRFSDEHSEDSLKPKKDKYFNTKEIDIFNHSLDIVDMFNTVEETEEGKIERSYHKASEGGFYLREETKKFKRK